VAVTFSVPVAVTFSVPQINIETLLTANRDEIDLDLIREEWSLRGDGGRTHGLA